MLIVGLTGGFGTGKTFVASVFKSLGAKVLDADSMARRAIRKDSPIYKKVVRAFGKGILGVRRDIDRKKLAGLVFAKKTCLKKLNAIVHPAVIRDIKKSISKSSGRDVIVIDAPLLIEAGLGGIAGIIVVVKASLDTEIKRCHKKLGFTREESMRRIRSQMPLERKIELADFVIDNDNCRAETIRQVKYIWEKVTEGKRPI